MRKVKLQERAPSLACVFLTDKASGLGEHSGPPGQCWCRASACADGFRGSLLGSQVSVFLLASKKLKAGGFMRAYLSQNPS